MNCKVFGASFLYLVDFTFRRSWFKDDSTKWKGTIRLWSLKGRDKCPMSRANWTFNPLGKIRSDQIWYIGMPRFATCLMFQVTGYSFWVDCEIFYTNLLDLFCQFISWTNWVNSGKLMDNCWISMSSYGWYGKILRRSHNY